MECGTDLAATGVGQMPKRSLTERQTIRPAPNRRPQNYARRHHRGSRSPAAHAAEDYHQDYHNQNPVSYKYYKWGCGRAQRLAEIWGKPS